LFFTYYTLDYVYTSAGHSQPTILVALDLSSAFDTIDHHTLLLALYKSCNNNNIIIIHGGRSIHELQNITIC